MTQTTAILQTALNELDEISNIGHIEITAEQQDEIEALENYGDMIEAEEAASGRGEHYLGESSVDLADMVTRPDFVSMVKEASADVVVKTTRNEYER